MKKNNKFISFITKYPVIISLVLVIPLLVNVSRYIFKEETIFYNDFYEGEELDVDDSKFALTGIKKIGKVAQASSNYSYQGAACYKDKYVVCLDNLEAIHIYDSNNMQLLHTVNGEFNRDYHCNQIA